MSKIQPINLTKTENMFKASMRNGKEITMKFAKENGQLKSARIFDVKYGEETMSASYSFGTKASNKTTVYKKLVTELSDICDKAQEGAKLFADIMGWIK